MRLVEGLSCAAYTEITKRKELANAMFFQTTAQELNATCKIQNRYA